MDKASIESSAAPMQCGEWNNRIILDGRMGVTDPPVWLAEAYRSFRDTVLHPEYPCYFGSIAERQGDIYYSYLEEMGDLAHLPATLQAFMRISNAAPRRRNNLALFLAPEPDPAVHEEYRARFWRILQYLYENDPAPELNREPLDPSDTLWEFPFSGCRFFVVAASPSYQLRRSRNLGSGMVLLFQPRDVFQDPVSGKAVSAASRQLVRERLERWDAVAPHPELGVYGDPAMREWKQYFLSDDGTLVKGQCPLRIEQRGAAAPSGGCPVSTGEIRLASHDT